MAGPTFLFRPDGEFWCLIAVVEWKQANKQQKALADKMNVTIMGFSGGEIVSFREPKSRSAAYCWTLSERLIGKLIVPGWCQFGVLVADQTTPT